MSVRALFRAQIIGVVLLAVAGLTGALLTLSGIKGDSREVNSHAEAALEATRISSHAGALSSSLTTELASILTGAQAAGFTPEQVDSLQAAVIMAEMPLLTAEESRFEMPPALANGIALQRSLDQLAVEAEDLLIGDPEGAALLRHVQASSAALQAYFRQSDVVHFRDLYQSVGRVRVLADELSVSRSLAARSQMDGLEGRIRLANLGVVFLLVLGPGALVGLHLWSIRNVGESFASAQKERDKLTATGDSLVKRNNQLSALYNVFTEITDTLSLHYVVEATLREARNLIKADLVELRLVREGTLAVAGTLLDDGGTLEDRAPLPLGAGLAGRAGKRGKSMRVDDAAETLMTPEERVEGMRSGLVLPLIVGARVVGTLSCWSRRPHVFTQDDERVMEMMASQVATAVSAADMTETSERRAHHDALTGLPNRRQLTEDMNTDLEASALAGGRVVVGMLDIDNFKHFNDEFGHRVGDVTLQQVSSVLRTSLREKDRVYRYGGEEFLLVFEGVGPGEAEMLSDRLRAAIQATPFSGESLQPVGPVTVSIGLASYPEHGGDIESLIMLADDAMYRSKARGRNQITVWSPAESAVA